MGRPPTHGQSKPHPTPAYNSWRRAKHRCNDIKDKKYHLYGGRGIRFLFDSFEQFFEELGPRPDGMTLDRILSDGHYEPGNVKWSTVSEQNYNRRPYKWKKPRSEEHNRKIREANLGRKLSVESIIKRTKTRFGIEGKYGKDDTK